MNSDSATTALIASLENQRYQAMQQGDLDSFKRLAHPELVYVHSNGVQDDLSRYLHKCHTGFTTITASITPCMTCACTAISHWPLGTCRPISCPTAWPRASTTKH